jgi:hypothetical protein
MARRRSLLRILAVVVVLEAVACVGSAVAPGDTPVPEGAWAGDHASLIVKRSGAHAEFDCASGDITQPLLMNHDGQASADGVYLQGRGGPIRDDVASDPQPARYTVVVKGDKMTLEVVLTGSNEHIGPFTLTLGGDPRVRKCL